MSFQCEVEPGSPNNEDFCACCLSNKDRLVNLLCCKHLVFFKSIPNFVINHRIKHVCTRCHNKLTKFIEFKQQVTESFQRLNDQTPQQSSNKNSKPQHPSKSSKNSMAQIDLIPDTDSMDTDDIGSVSDIQDVKGEQDSDLEDEIQTRTLKRQRFDTQERKKAGVAKQTSEQTSNEERRHTDTDNHFETVYTDEHITEEPLNSSVATTLLHNQQALLDVTNMILETQKTIITKLETITESGDPFPKVCNRSSLSSKPDAEPGLRKPVKSLEELDEFEECLKDSNYRIKLINDYSSLYNPAPGIGTNCAYKMLDLLFNRQFLCHCSWSGGSRGEGMKVAIKCYKNVLDFFSEMIQCWDSTFSVENTEEFFKMVLKNAVKRSKAKLMRASRKRHRQSRMDIKTKRLIEAIVAGENIEETDDGHDFNSLNE